MNQYSILKDVLTDKAYGLAVKSIDGFEFMGFNEQSCKWANLANQKQLDISQLPDGIIAEDLQDITEDIAAQLNLKIKAPLAVVKHKEKLNNFNFKESERFDTGSTTPSITDIPLGEFEKEVRDMVLEFKAKSFKKNIVQSEIALKSRFNQLAFNLSTNRFQPRPNSNFKQIQADELRTKASNGMQRRFGKEITEQINSTIETKWPGEFITGFLLGRRRRRKKRKKMSFKTMEILDFHEKGIGRAIGRAATPNVGRSRRIGMRASRKITGQLDPSKRRDVDGDGMIFDGTWREMPDPTRFKPNERVRKPFSPDPNKPIGSQSLQILEENEKRRGDFARMLREVERGIPQTTRKPRSERSTRGVSSRVYRSGQDSGAETPRKNLQPLPTNVKGFIQRLKEKYAKPIDSNDPELTESLRKIIKEREARDGIARESSLQALFREWENGFISDRNRKAALDFLDGIEKDYQKQDNQSPSVTTRPVSQEDRIAAAHLAKLIAMSDDDYKESNFNAIRDIDYSPIPEALKRRTEQDRQFNQDFDRRNPNLARQSRASGLRSRVYRPGQDTGAETYIDDIPDMSDDDLRKEIERLENARYPYDGNVTKPRMDKERIEEMRRELQRRSRGGGRKPIKKPSRALDNPSTEGLEAARLFLENIKKNRRNLTESEREALVNERTPLRGLSSQSDGGRQEIERLVVSEGYPSKAKRKKMFVSKEDVDSFIEDLKLEYRKRRRQIESEIDSDGYYMDDEELIQRFMNDYNMSRGEARQAMRDYRRNWDLLEKEDERHQNRLTELEEERAKLPYQQEIDDPIKLGPNGFPEREDQMERYEELMKEEAEPVFRVRKKPEAGGKRENVGERSARGVSSRTASRDSVSDEEGRIGSVRQATQRASETIQGRRQQRGLSDEEGRIGSVRQAAQRASENRQNRGLLPVAMTPNARRAMANTQRASSPRGLQSRSGVQKQSKGIPGVDKIGPSDGAQWEALTPDQKTTATTALDKELDRVTGELKKRFAGYWRGQVRGAKKQGIRGGRYAPRDTTEYLTTSDITEMQRQLDSNTSSKPEVRAAVQKQIDAIRLLTTMKSKKDYSMLEQLHPAQKAKVLDALKKTDDFKPLKGFTRTSESTAFKGGAGLSKEDLLTSLTPDISLDDKKKDKKNISFRNRILRANPERQRRRELRRQRRTGAIGRTGISLDPELQLKKRKLRAAAFKRQILSKFRKTKDAEQLADSLGDRKAELHPVQIDANGNIKLAPNFVETMDSLDKRLLEGKKDGDKVYDVLLRDLWENFGYSEVPALVTEEEVKSLLAAGWQPIVRGTGNEEVMSESYVEQFLTSEGRFIAGQGGRAYGVGEYFAYPGGNWSGYSGTADSRHTMLALIPPTATIMTRQELSNEQREMNRLTTAINNEFRIAGDRETVSVLSAQELAQMIRKASPQLANSKTRSGQILNQLTLRLEELDNMPGDTSQERKRILNTFDLLERMSKKESGHFAPMIGVDAIDTNDGDGSKDPVLLHNRSIVAAFQTPMTRKQAEEMSAGVKKVWTKFKSRNKVVSAEQSPDSDSTATRRVKPRLIRRARSNTPQQQTQQSAQPQSQAKKSSGVVDTSSWKTGTPQNVGSNPAKLLTAPDGTEYYAKLPKPNENVQQATERMETEVLASELYKLAGVPTVDLMMGDENGTPQMLSKMIQSRGPNSQSDQDSARAGFVVDAWLANWDAPLNDNIKFDSQNRPVRIDVGGSLDYRAQGAKKDTTRTPFGDTVGEILSMQKRGTFNFANMDPAEIKKQAQAMSSVTDASIRATVSKIVGDPQRAAKLAQTLINRRNDIVTRYG